MFNKSKLEPSGNKESETIIGPNISVKGNFHGEGDIIIEGRVEGEIKTNAYLFVGDKAVIKANIDALNARIGGKVDGDLNIVEYLELSSSARVNGKIKARELSIEKGAIIDGIISMSANDEVQPA